MEDGRYVDGSIWFYAPNKGAPIFFAIAFGASGIYHLYQCIHYKSWRLTGILVFCAMLFTAGFIAREFAAFDYGHVVKLIVAICLVYAAPPIFELANYNILGRILYYVPQLSPIHPGRVITTCGLISGVVEALNGNGASYSSNQSLSLDKQNMGRALLKASLVIQIFVVAAFIALAVIFHRRTIKAGIRNANLTNALITLYISTGLLSIRTIYRVTEYFILADMHFGPGFDPNAMSAIIRYEWFFYFFEATLMLCNQVLMNVRHPRKYLPKSTKVYLAEDGVTEITGPGYKEQRHFLMTIIDPFDIGSIIKGKEKEKRFWETNETTDKTRPKDAADPEAA